MEIKSKLKFNHPLLLILLIATILRCWGIWHGYPFSYYPDEQHFINRAMAFGSGDFNPHWFHKPAFMMYLLFFEYGLFYLLGHLVGIFPNVDSFAVYFFKNPWPFILLGRITVSLFGIATIWIVYRMGERIWSKRVGIYSALFLCLSYGHIFSGQDVKADIPTTFFTVLSVYYMLRLITDNFPAKYYVLVGLFAGLGTATKYYSIALLPCIFVVSIYECVKKRNILLIRKYLYSFTAFWISYFVASPFNFLDPLGRRGTFMDIVSLFNKISPLKLEWWPPLQGSEIGDGGGAGIISSVIDYCTVLLSTSGVGPVLGFLFILSSLYLIYKPSMKKIVLLSFPFLFSLISVVFHPSYTEPRHQLIIYPFLATAAGIALAGMTKRTRHIFKPTLIVMLMLIFPFFAVIKNNIYISKTDTRTLAKYWIEENIPAGTKVLLDEYSPALRMNKKNIEAYYEEAKGIEAGQFTTHMERYYHYQLLASQGITYDIKEIRHAWWRDKEIAAGEAVAATEFDEDMGNPIKSVGVNDYKYYMERGYKYVITSSASYESFINENSRKALNFPSFKKFYAELFTEGELVKEFNPTKLNVPGPTIKIIKIFGKNQESPL